jgi:hypothetical protein
MCRVQLRSQVVSLASRVPDFQVSCLRASYSSSRRTRPSVRSVHSPRLKVFPIDLFGERPTLIPFHLANLYSLVLVNSFSVGLQVNCSQSILSRTNWYLGLFFVFVSRCDRSTPRTSSILGRF